ncbi:MAG: MBL fold metallo-hydrolase [Deltaproteobacteria bacterium]|nr:MBL fold metallo-hydrolase [Deltaproteobacteria bacterium]
MMSKTQNPKSRLRRIVFIILWLAMPYFLAGLSGWEVQAACRNPNVALGGYSIVPAAASGLIEIKWFGHSFFQITSGGGTRIITDPFGPMGFPMPEVWPHVVTIGRDHGNHNNAGLAKGNPLVLRGLKEGGSEWSQVNTHFRDVLIYNVPVHQRGIPGYEGSLRGSAFIFEMDGLCICHSGDISEPFNEDQLQLIGHVDILLQVIGGVYTAGPEAAKKIVEQLKPKIVVPMHYWYSTNVLQRFTDGPYRVRSLEINKLTISKDTLPAVTEIIVLKVIREGDL